MVVEKSGQLGNQLILFSHLIALAEELGICVANPSFVDYSFAFKGTRDVLFPAFPPTLSRAWSSRHLQDLIFRATNIYARGARRGYWGRGAHFIETPGVTPEFDKDLSQSPYLEAIMANKVTFLFGWRYRSYELFHKHSDLIRDFFTPVAHQEQIRRYMGALRERFDVLVAVHIRQGDYATFQGGKYFLTTEKYRNIVMGVVEEMGQRRVGVIVFSNIKQDLLVFDPLNAIAGLGDALSDLHCMALTDYIVAVPSTFSRWASFYGKVPLGVVNGETLSIPLSEFAVAVH